MGLVGRATLGLTAGASASPDAASAQSHMETCYCRPAVPRQPKWFHLARGLPTENWPSSAWSLISEEEKTRWCHRYIVHSMEG